MKTKQFIIPAVAFILGLTALFYSHYAIATAFFLYLSVNLFIGVRDTISQLTSNLTDAERDARYWKERFDLGNMWSKKDAEYIQELSAELETAKANSYTEIERKRGREKYNRLYKGKKKAKDQPYTIEGKTIKQLVEENLGINIKTNLKNNYFLCGLESNCKKGDVDQIIACNIKSNELLIYDQLPYCKSENKVYNWCSYEQLISAIKKHRNIK